MSEMRIRPQFQCCNPECPGGGEPFSLVVDLAAEGEHIVVCPYCNSECVADLAPYRERVVEVYRDGRSSPIGERYRLPEVIPTTAKDEA